MSFKQRLKAAGFYTKKQFAEYIGKTPETVSRWGDDVPEWVNIVLDVNFANNVPAAIRKNSDGIVKEIEASNSLLRG